ncbi:ectonucleotide pyrophosphatase phosphodiesterase [Nesidiocoris tenuis]|uniref:Ectonucleotide pyrophosphatase phosphodiesterase n=1 Tax=Nesidiocoris tenuis TaxID=355587 RepID=A0ABN7AAR6_9HEMI|nr:ectonucleotide pyrophosphatase phosphodiesterase [Nesidiocoris tenuis]
MELIILCLWMLAILDVSWTRALDRLLVVSFDGFRYDYLNRSLTPNIQNLIRQSTYSERILSVFPSQTFPNHFSIATGRYVEEHGVLANELMDLQTQEIYKFGYKLFHYNETTVPIWTLNELKKEGRHSGCMMWVGCSMAYQGTNGTYSVEFDLSIPWDDRIEKSVSWFTDPVKPANLVMLYFESPDQEGHIYGPDSPETNAQIQRVDKTVQKLLQVLKAKNLSDVNLVVLSDHGMESVTLPRIINLTGVIGDDGKWLGTSPVLQIYPNKGKTDALYERLQEFSKRNGHFDVYKKQDIPEIYHYKNCDRAPPILAVAKPKYGFHDLYSWIDEIKKKHKLTVTNQTEFGVHGYDPQTLSMQPFFIAKGPKFEKGLKLDKPLKVVDLYGIFADVLGLKASPVEPYNRKLLHPVRSPLVAQESTHLTLALVGYTLASLIALTALFTLFILFRRRQEMRNLGYTLVDKDESGI